MGVDKIFLEVLMCEMFFLQYTHRIQFSQNYKSGQIMGYVME